jgi:glycosyltransferase involved in cell wall biosynthesis
MNVSVAICTWNRATLLRQTLNSMLSLRIPSGVTWELVVIDNNSADGTQGVLVDYAGNLPLRRFFEPVPGQTIARNRAINEVRGDLIIWTDDDVLVDPGWLAAYVDAADRFPTAAFFGGPIIPVFEGEPPRWLQRTYPAIKSAYAARDLGNEPGPLTEGNFPFGANMAARTHAQRRYLFDPSLGLSPGRSLRGDESAVFRAMVGDGLEGRWVRDAKVQHFIPRERQTLRYLRAFYRGMGQLYARKGVQVEGAHLFGSPRWAWRSAVEHEVLFWLKRYLQRPESWMENLIHANQSWGVVFPPAPSSRIVSRRSDPKH